MKLRILLILSLLALMSSTPWALAGQKDDGFSAFWQKFKTAVINGDKAAVGTMSRFPINMSFGIRSIKNQADLNKRFRAVFNEQTNAAKCFAKKTPEKDRKNYAVYCPNEAGDEVVEYLFERTKTGWKFIALDNINE